MNDHALSRLNASKSPTFDILRVSDIFNLQNEVDGMIQGTRYYSKKQWNNLVWSRAWEMENRDWKIRTNLFKVTKYVSKIQEGIQPLIWWQIGDISHDLMRYCETMVRLVCRASK